MSSKKIIVIGSSNTDMTVKTEYLPKPGETVLGDGFIMTPGGKGANQAVAVKRLGGDVSFVAKVGNDVFGKNAIEHYKNEGIDTELITASSKPSGIALISVDKSGENSIVVASGANLDLSPDDIMAIEPEIIKADIMLLQLEIPMETVLAAARIAYKAGVYVVLNPAPASPIPDELFKYVSLFIPNETELAKYSGVDTDSIEDVRKAAQIMISKGVKGLVVTLGSRGSMIFDNGESHVVEAKKVKVMDTTAAGDTFCGGICVALSEGKSLEEAVVFATSASAITVQHMGAQCSIPFRKDIQI